LRTCRPGGVAADVVAGAIAPPARSQRRLSAGDSYAYDNGNRGGYGQYRHYDDSYAARNGFVCQPGTWFKGEDGRRHLCQ
jgi:hypothetical protein